MHYSWNEWANAFIVQRVMLTELDYLCDTKSLSCSHMRSCNLVAETRAEIVGAAMRSWPSYRYDAMMRLDRKVQNKRGAGMGRGSNNSHLDVRFRTQCTGWILNLTGSLISQGSASSVSLVFN